MSSSAAKSSSLSGGSGGTSSPSSTLDRLSQYLSTCTKLWLVVYLVFCVLVSLKCVMMHVASVGLLLCLLSYWRLPAADPADAFKVLGRDPRNLDGSPTRSKSRGVLGLIARRSAPLDAPENSIAAAKKVKKNGGKCIHADVSFTSDGIAVALRPKNLNELDKTRSIKESACDLTFKEVQKTNVAAAHSYIMDEYSPTYPPTIDDLSDICMASDLRVFYEIAMPTRMSAESIADYFVNDLFKKRPKLYGIAVVTSPWPHVLYAIRQKDPRIVCGLVWKRNLLKTTFPKSFSIVANYIAGLGDLLLSWAVHEFLWYFLGVAVIVADKDVVTAPYTQMWRSRGLRLIATSANKSLERLFIEKELRVTCMSETMDEIPFDKILEDDNIQA